MDLGLVTSHEIADALRANETRVSKAMGNVDEWRHLQTLEVGMCHCHRLIRYVNDEWHHENGREYAHTPNPRVLGIA